jgi:hypothetical protein
MQDGCIFISILRIYREVTGTFLALGINDSAGNEPKESTSDG